MTRCQPLSLIARCLLLFALCALPSAFANAQSATATLSGTVLDANGAVVPNATVAVTDPAKGLKRQTTTNENGSFTVVLLPPSTYTVTVEQTGFAPVEIQNVILNVNDQRSLRIELKVGQVGAAVEVTTDAPLLVDDSPAVGTVVDRRFVGNLPLNGRTLQSLIRLVPGVVETTVTGTEQGQFSVNGQRANTNYFTIDGVGANIGISRGQLGGQSTSGSLPALTTSGGTNNLVSIDALQEFKLETSTYSAQSGRSPGGQLSIVTRSGTNDFRGTLFEYFRNEALDANDWFANSRGLKRVPLRLNNFGGVFGGPVLLPCFGEGGKQPCYNGRNKTFFFFSYEGQRLRLPQTRLSTVPSLSLRQTAAASVQPLVNAFPLPNGRDLGNGRAEFNSTYSDPTEVNATSIRVDHVFSDTNTLFGRYNHSPSESITRSLITLNSSFSTTKTLTLGMTSQFTKSVSNELRFNWSRVSGGSRGRFDNSFGGTPLSESSLLPPFASLDDSIFSFSLPGGGASIGTGASNVQRQINIVNNLSIVKGNHQLRAGVDYRRLYPFLGPSKYSVNYVFFSPANVTANTPFTIVGALEPLTVIFSNFSAYAQDTWKIGPRFTLDYGVRWELVPPPHGTDGKELYTVNGLDNPSTLAFAPAGTPLWKTRYNNFAPRVGAAYQLSQKQGSETVLRGGFGVFYDLGTGLVADAAARAPYLRISPLVPNTFPANPASIPIPPVSLTGPFLVLEVFRPDIKLPYTLQWNFSLERSFGANQTITASYVGASGRRLLRREYLQNPSLTFQNVFVTKNEATSDYNSLQLQYQRRLSNGFQALVSYTFSKSVDTASEDSSPQLVPSSRTTSDQDRGPSSFDTRHNFSTALSYDLPSPFKNRFAKGIFGNWSVDAIIKARSAKPVDVVVQQNLGFGFYNFRPDLVQGVPIYIDDPTQPRGQRINPAAFSIPSTLRQGNLPRNALRGFPVYQVDLALRRQFNLTERVNFQLRAEAFNVFNHPNFADPGGFIAAVFFGQTFTNPFFGTTTSMLGRSLGGLNPLFQMGGPRSIQLALKLQF